MAAPTTPGVVRIISDRVLDFWRSDGHWALAGRLLDRDLQGRHLALIERQPTPRKRLRVLLKWTTNVRESARREGQSSDKRLASSPSRGSHGLSWVKEVSRSGLSRPDATEHRP